MTLMQQSSSSDRKNFWKEILICILGVKPAFVARDVANNKQRQIHVCARAYRAQTKS
jgi:hypothetical protein